jgi:transcriptional regulator with XRE-family HTH domain
MTVSRIARNIRDLRKAHGETQKELGKAINVEENTISMYESGKRQPDMQTIQNIAAHYGFPVDRLIDDNFSQMDFRMSTMTWDKMIVALEAQFPIICSEKAMQDQHFANGFKRTQEIWKKLKLSHESIMSSSVELALDDYETSLRGLHNLPGQSVTACWLHISVAAHERQQCDRHGTYLPAQLVPVPMSAEAWALSWEQSL